MASAGAGGDGEGVLAGLQRRTVAARDGRDTAACIELLAYIRKKQLRQPLAVVRAGKKLVEKHSGRLGEDKWTVLEQVCLAGLEVGDGELVGKCFTPLKNKFGIDSTRVKVLFGRMLESEGELGKAEELYKELLEDNAANGMARKRLCAVAAAKGGSDNGAATALNEYLTSYGSDWVAWLELANLHMTAGRFEEAAFCFDELVLIDPNNAVFHAKLAECYFSLGGEDNEVRSRQHYSLAVKASKRKYARALIGLAVVTAALAHRRGGRRVEDSEANATLFNGAASDLKALYKAAGASAAETGSITDVVLDIKQPVVDRSADR